MPESEFQLKSRQTDEESDTGSKTGKLLSISQILYSKLIFNAFVDLSTSNTSNKQQSATKTNQTKDTDTKKPIKPEPVESTSKVQPKRTRGSLSNESPVNTPPSSSQQQSAKRRRI